MQGQATSTCQHWMGVGVVNGCLSAELAGRILAPPATPMWIDDGLVCGSQAGLAVDAKRSLTPSAHFDGAQSLLGFDQCQGCHEPFLQPVSHVAVVPVEMQQQECFVQAQTP